MKKVSLIVTILNEEVTIIALLESILKQTFLPKEVIIVDGGSIDNTISLVNNFIKKQSQIPINFYIKKGNRSVGRNFAIYKSKNNLIAITDAGCILDKNWLKELVKKQKETKADVVAGYYKAQAETLFEKAVVPYVLVMPDKIDVNNFLPATRSMLIKKQIWKIVGGFNNKLNDNEDYAFAQKINKYFKKEVKESQLIGENLSDNNNFKIAFSKNAIVNWLPNKNLKSFVKMIFRFARGDIYAGIIRLKVLLIFARYLFVFGLISYGILVKNFCVLFVLIPLLFLIYIMWSIYKNYAYSPESWFLLPVLQLSSDFAVMWGSIYGLFKRFLGHPHSL